MQVEANFAASLPLMSKLDFHFHSYFHFHLFVLQNCNQRLCVFFFTPAPFAATAAVENALSGAGIYPLFIHSLSTRATIKCYCCRHLRPILSNKTMHLFLFGFKVEKFVVEQITIDFEKKDKQQSSVTVHMD